MRALALTLALAMALAGCIAQPQAAPLAGDGLPPAAPVAPEVVEFSDGETFIVTLPVVGGEASFKTAIDEGWRWLAGTLTWSTRGTTLTMTVTDPSGQERGESRSLAGTSPRSPARLDWWVADPEPGPWTYTIRGDGVPPLLREPITLQLHTAKQITGMHVAQRTAVPPGAFVEVNMEMKAGDAVTFDWTTASPVYFNIHTHRNGETINLVEDTTDAMTSTFTAEEDGGYSLLWALEGGATPLPSGDPVPLTYRVDGAFDLHSAVG